MRAEPARAARGRRHHELRGDGPRRPAAAVRHRPTRTSRPRIDGSAYLEQKMDALRAYPTQITLDGPFFALSNNEGNQMWGVEYFRIAKGELRRARRGRAGVRPVRRHRAVASESGRPAGPGDAAGRHRGWPSARSRSTSGGGGCCWRAAATLLVLFATPPGWATRLPLAVGFVGTVALMAVPRGEGDYLVASTGAGLRRARPRPGRALVSIATLPRPGRPTFRRKSACGVTHVPTVNM